MSKLISPRKHPVYANTPIRKAWVVIWRQGGYQRFTWHKTQEYTTQVEAVAARNTIERRGYRAHVQDAWLTERIGLPDTFDIPGPPRRRPKGVKPDLTLVEV